MLSGLLKHTPKLKFLLKDNSSTILTGVGVAGTLATAYLTGRATFKAAEIIARENNALELAVEDATMDSHDLAILEKLGGNTKLTKFDQVKLVWPHYIPPAVVVVVTITSVVAANRISSKKIAALVVASGISDRALTEYKAKVIEKFGERKETDIRDEIAQEQVNRTPGNSREIVLAGTGEVLCFDTLTGRYFQSTVEEIKRAENRVNYELIHFNSASLSMFYEEVGLPATDYTDSVGWNLNNKMEVIFTTTMSQDNRPCLAVSFSQNPTPNYDKIWE